MPTDDQLMLVRLEATLAKFERQMKQASGAADKSARKIEGSFTRMQSRTAASASAAAAGIGKAFAAIGGIMLFRGAISKAKEALSEFDLIGKRARQYGLSAEFYQVIGVAAEEASVSQESLNVALRTFTKNVGDARNGTGTLITALKDNNAELLAGLTNARSQEQAMRVLADGLKNTATASDRAAIAAAVFGGRSSDLVRVLEQGAQVFDTTAAKAHAMGLIISDELIASSEVMANKFGLASKVLDLQLKVILVELAPLLTATATGMAAAAREAKQLVDALKALANGSFKEILAFLAGTSSAGDGSLFGVFKAAAEDAAAFDSQMEILQHRLILQKRDLASTPGDTLYDKAREAAAAAVAETERLIAALQGVVNITNMMNNDAAAAAGRLQTVESPAPGFETTGRTRTPTITPGYLMPNKPRKTGGGGGGTNDFQSEIESVKQRTDALLLEAKTFGLAADQAARLTAETELLAAAEKAGITLTAAQKEQVSNLANAYASATAAVERMKAAQAELDEIRNAGRESFQGFISDLAHGKDAADAFHDALGKIADKLIDMATKGLFDMAFGASGSPGTGLFGGLGKMFGFAGGGVMGAHGPMPLHSYAGGGIARSPQLAMFGEGGRNEAFVPLPDGRSIPVTMKNGGASRMAIDVTVTPSSEFNVRIDHRIRGAAPAIVNASVQQTRKSLPGMISDTQSRVM